MQTSFKQTLLDNITLLYIHRLQGVGSHHLSIAYTRGLGAFSSSLLNFSIIKKYFIYQKFVDFVEP